MNRVSRVPPRKPRLAAVEMPADKERLNFSTDSMPSSIVPWATKLTTCTGCFWPSRWTRPMRCSSTAGFHGRSMFTTIDGMLQVQARAAGVGGQEDPAVGVVAEAVDQLRPLVRWHAAVEAT